MILTRIRPLAEADLIERTRNYRSEPGQQIGQRFFDTAVDALHTIEKMPGIGSTRLGDLCDVPGLRSLRITGFPCGWFYFHRDDYIDVVRLLSYAQDLPNLLAEIDES